MIEADAVGEGLRSLQRRRAAYSDLQGRSGQDVAVEADRVGDRLNICREARDHVSCLALVEERLVLQGSERTADRFDVVWPQQQDQWPQQQDAEMGPYRSNKSGKLGECDGHIRARGDRAFDCGPTCFMRAPKSVDRILRLRKAYSRVKRDPRRPEKTAQAAETTRSRMTRSVKASVIVPWPVTSTIRPM